jgi:hypothetical protein
MSMFWNTASAVPRYQSCSDTRWLAGKMSKLSLRSARMKLQPRVRWRIRLCALYCVATPMRRMPEFSALDSAKSMMRVLPPKNTPGLARRSVSSIRRLPRPPASTKAMVSRARRDVLWGLFLSSPLLSVNQICQLKTTVASGGKARCSDCGRPIHGTGSAVISPNGAPTLLPP